MHNHQSGAYVKNGWFNLTAPITCPGCIERLWDLRDELCSKYGWAEWPEALNKDRDYLPRRDK